MRRSGFALALVGLLAVGCTVDSPVDPAGLLEGWAGISEQVGNRLADLVADPLGNRPYPVLVGGDSARIFYATNLGDVRVRFSGPTDDLVIPGILGPSNLYRIVDGERELLQPLVPAGALSGLTTDGQWIACIVVPDLEAPTTEVRVAQVWGEPFTIYAAPEGDVVLPPLAISAGRVAFMTVDIETGAATLRVLAIEGAAEVARVETVGAFDLLSDRLAYAIEADGGGAIVLHDLAVDEATELARGSGLAGANVYLTNNAVVWGVESGEGHTAVSAYDLPTATVRVWADAADGTLTGAADGFFVTEEEQERSTTSYRIVVRAYDDEGTARELARFRAHGLAGQATIFGRRVAFVNAERRIVTALPTGEDRESYAPF